MDCIFCKIANKILPAKIIYEDELVMVFDDIHPKAPIHKLIIPKKHIATLNDVNSDDEHLLNHMLMTAKKIAKDLGVDQSGYRVVINCNADGGQIIYHLHLHLMGGKLNERYKNNM